MDSQPMDSCGDLVLTEWRDPADLLSPWRVRVDQADEAVRISDEVLNTVRIAQEADLPGYYAAVGEGIFVIYATNGTVRYRLDIHNKQAGYWRASRIGPAPSTSGS